MVVIQLLIDIGGSGHYQVRGPSALPLLSLRTRGTGAYIYLSHSLHTKTSDKYCILPSAFRTTSTKLNSVIYRQDFQLRIALRQGFTTFFVNFLAHTPKRL